MQIEVQCTQWEGGGFWYGGKIKTEVKNEEVPPCELGTYPAFYSSLYQKKKSWRIQTIRNPWIAAMKWKRHSPMEKSLKVGVDMLDAPLSLWDSMGWPLAPRLGTRVKKISADCIRIRNMEAKETSGLENFFKVLRTHVSLIWEIGGTHRQASSGYSVHSTLMLKARTEFLQIPTASFPWCLEAHLLRHTFAPMHLISCLLTWYQLAPNKCNM